MRKGLIIAAGIAALGSAAVATSVVASRRLDIETVEYPSVPLNTSAPAADSSTTSTSGATSDVSAASATGSPYNS